MTADEVEVEIRTPAVSIKTGEKLTYYQIEDGVENLIGVFYAEAPTVATKTSIRFKAYDGKAKLAADFSEWLNANQDRFPMTLRSLVGIACEVAGVPLAVDLFGFDSLPIPAFYAQGVTCRQIVRWAAQIAGRFVSCNTAGEIFFDWYRKTDISIGKTDFSQDGLSKKAYYTDLIKRVQFKQETNDVGVIYPADADGNVFSISQNGIAAVLDSDTLRTIAQSLYEKLKSITYTPLSVRLPKRTAKIRAGDIISVTDGNGSTVSAYVMKVYLDSSGTQISSTGDQNYADKAAVSSEQYRNIPGKVLLLEKSVDGIKIENADTKGKLAKLELDVDKIELGVSEAMTKAEAAQATADAAVKDLSSYATQVSGSLTDLQNQIDGAIETWFYNYVPTATNAPASSWATTEDKNKHLGDLFYIVDNADKGGLVYRWALVNGVYGWVLVEDTEVAKALETASQAKDTADGKRRVFVTRPAPPYDVGDLWTDGTNLRVCQTARASGSYNAGDWGLATEYITETSAKALINVAKDNITLQVEEVEKKTSTAQAQADKALETANGIEIGGRNLLRYTNQGTTGWSYESYDGESAVEEYVTPEGIRAVKVTITQTTTSWYYAEYSIDTTALKGLKPNTHYTVSFDFLTDMSAITEIRISIKRGDATNPLTNSASAPITKRDGKTWNKIVAVLRTNDLTGEIGNQVIYLTGFNHVGYFVIKNLKLELGNKATDWTPAPEDTEGEIKEIKQEVSTLKVTSKGVDMVSEDENGKLATFIGNRDGKGVWESKYFRDGRVTSGLEFDATAGKYKFDGDIIGGSININDRFKVDSQGNVTLPDNASISWSQVSEKPNNLATTEQVTEITKDTVTTSYVDALGVKAGSVDAEDITGTTIVGKVLSGVTGEFSGTVTATYLKAVSGGNIAGWTIDDNSMRIGSLGASGSMWLCNTGTSTSASIGTGSGNGWCIAVGDKFGVKRGGQLFGKDVDLSGKITAESGVIGGFEITPTAIKSAVSSSGLALYPGGIALGGYVFYLVIYTNGGAQPISGLTSSGWRTIT